MPVDLSEDRIPLLSRPEGEEDGGDDLRDLQIEFEKEYPLRTPPRDAGVQSQAQPRGRLKHYSGNEMIVAVFVVAFDTKKGM